MSAKSNTVKANCALAQAIPTATDGSPQGSCASFADNAAGAINLGAGFNSVAPTASLPDITEALTSAGSGSGWISANHVSAQGVRG